MLLASEISKLRQYLATQPVERAFLFGSVARNDKTASSDIDLLVELDRNARVGLVKFASIKLGLERVLNKKVDLLSVGGVSKYLLPLIEKEKKLVYEK
jgi:predicted nucleotidyltransferase